MEEKASAQTWQEKLKRIDWLGSFVVILAVCPTVLYLSCYPQVSPLFSVVLQVSSLMVSLSLHTSFDVPLANPSVWGLLVVCVFSTISFYFIEEYYASEPVVPMRLLRMKTPALINIAMGFYTSTLFARSVAFNFDCPSRGAALLNTLSPSSGCTSFRSTFTSFETSQID